MKKYIFENTVKQQADVLCYAFSPDLIDASEKELKEFLKVGSTSLKRKMVMVYLDQWIIKNI